MRITNRVRSERRRLLQRVFKELEAKGLDEKQQNEAIAAACECTVGSVRLWRRKKAIPTGEEKIDGLHNLLAGGANGGGLPPVLEVSPAADPDFPLLHTARPSRPTRAADLALDVLENLTIEEFKTVQQRVIDLVFQERRTSKPAREGAA